VGDPLVLANRATKNDALIGISRRFLKSRKAEADTLDRKQDPLRIQPLQEIFETSALFPDQMLFRHFQAINEERVTLDRLTAHFRDRIGFDLAAIKIGIEERKPQIGLGALILRRRPRDDQDLVGPLRACCPDLAAIDRVAGIGALGLGLQRRRIEPGIRFSHGEAHLLLSGDDLGQVFLLLLMIAELFQRLWSEDVEMNRRGAGIACA